MSIGFLGRGMVLLEEVGIVKSRMASLGLLDWLLEAFGVILCLGKGAKQIRPKAQRGDVLGLFFYAHHRS